MAQRAVRQSHIGNQVSFRELKGQRGHSVHVCVFSRLRPLRAQGLQRRGGRQCITERKGQEKKKKKDRMLCCIQGPVCQLVICCTSRQAKNKFQCLRRSTKTEYSFPKTLTSQTIRKTKQILSPHGFGQLFITISQILFALDRLHREIPL